MASAGPPSMAKMLFTSKVVEHGSRTYLIGRLMDILVVERVVAEHGSRTYLNAVTRSVPRARSRVRHAVRAGQGSSQLGLVAITELRWRCAAAVRGAAYPNTNLSWYAPGCLRASFSHS